MPQSIFDPDISDSLQIVDNRYELCMGLFDRARQVNRLPVAENGKRPNPTLRAFSDYTYGDPDEIASDD